MDGATDLRTRADARMARERDAGHAVHAGYDVERRRLVVALSTGVELSVPVASVEGLAGAAPDDLGEIEISPSGLGLHWPRLDADVWIPGLLAGTFGSRAWMAARLGERGGRSRSEAKAAAARTNGRKGGRPRRKEG